jgi:hypothetical protein
MSTITAIHIAVKKVRISCPRSIEAWIQSLKEHFRNRQDEGIDSSLLGPYSSTEEEMRAGDLIRQIHPANIMSEDAATTPLRRSSPSGPTYRCANPVNGCNRSILLKAL